MKLKSLNVYIESTDQFMNDITKALAGEIVDKEMYGSLSFQSIEHFKKALTQNRLEILMAISREQPDSVYQLAQFLNREHHHVVKDCKILEGYNLITLEEADSNKKQYIPRLSRDYDVIRVHAKMEEYFFISEKCNKVIGKLIA